VTLESIQKFWRERVGPGGYLKPIERSQELVRCISALGLTNPSILEIGCNCGRNLNFLWQAGFKDLEGIEISPRAEAAFRARYPDCGANFLLGSVEELIDGYPPNCFDVVFTMATLLHIHPESEWIFPHIARITRRYLLLVENEASAAVNVNKEQFHFPRDYKAIFEKLGLKQVDMRNGFGDLKKYTARLFEKAGRTTVPGT
jgi:SAM-dependent methyltransferase